MHNYGYPGYPYPGQQANPQTGNYRTQNNTTHFVTGLVAGAAVAYLLSNKKVQQGLTDTGSKAWSAVRGEVEELKEKLEDTKAELDYYRSRCQEQE